jgi:hypothetical protein
MKKIKNLQWEVTLSNRPQLYYKGRGETPEAALAELIETLQLGTEHVVQELSSQQRKLELLREALDGMRETTEAATDE